MGEIHWAEIVIAFVTNGAIGFIAYGALKTKVERTVSDIAALDVLVQTNQKLITQGKIDMHQQFVTYEAFKDFKQEMLIKQGQMEAKMDKILDIVGDIRAGLK